jgi:hypothetical protein
MNLLLSVQQSLQNSHNYHKVQTVNMPGYIVLLCNHAHSTTNSTQMWPNNLAYSHIHVRTTSTHTTPHINTTRWTSSHKLANFVTASQHAVCICVYAAVMQEPAGWYSRGFRHSRHR